MSCACYSITLTREPQESGFDAILSRVLGEDFFVTLERFCDEVVDLVAFNAADGHFFTEEGYTIIVKK